MPAIRDLGRGPLNAVAFLTVVPAPARALAAGDAAWFPLVGGVVGAVGGGVRAGAIQLVGRDAATMLGIVVAVVLTGALHQDGLADTCDGLGVRGDRDRRLAVMRDSTVGSFGVLALIGWALLLYTALAGFDGAHGLETMIAAGALARYAIVLHAYISSPARVDGLGAGLSVGALTSISAWAIAMAIVLPLVGIRHGALVLACTAVVAAGWIELARRAFGGRTGDTLGALAAISEVAVCLALRAVA